MVDPESVTARLSRLAPLLVQLERTRSVGEAAYLASDDLRAATERRLQLAIQICVDIGAHIVSELNARAPSDYADVFTSLAEVGQIDADLATRMARAARQRNLLVHAYIDLDDRQVFESLDHLDDIRDFAAAVQRILDSNQ